MAALWYEEYFQVLQRRNNLELRTKSIYDHYAHLARRIADLEKNAQSPDLPENATTNAAPPPPRPESTRGQVRSPPSNSDLAEAQKARSQLESRLKELRQELESVSATGVGDKKRVKELTMENTAFSIKLRDKDEELREKSKLLENLHDETLALTMQLNLIEEHNQKLKVENQDLVDRWMARKGQEADAMNNASKFS